MDYGLELLSPILEIVDRTIHTQFYPGNSGSYDPYILIISRALACAAQPRQQGGVQFRPTLGDFI